MACEVASTSSATPGLPAVRPFGAPDLVMTVGSTGLTLTSLASVATKVLTGAGSTTGP